LVEQRQILVSKPKFSTLKKALDYVGGFARPTKIPTWCYSIPAVHCITGSKLVGVPNSTCASCYALHGFYGSKWVAKAEQVRFESLKKPLWIDAMVQIINYRKLAFFRWHDSGDIQGLWHLLKIFEVCLRTPNTKHWIPTREWDMIRNFRELGIPKPSNLKIILSAHMINQRGPVDLARELCVQVSEVVTKNPSCDAHTKTVMVNNGRHNIAHGYCGACRKCWDEKVFSISYLLH